MIKKTIEKKYAQALFITAKDQENYDDILNQLAQVADYFNTENGIFQYLINPINDQKHKINIVKKIAASLNIKKLILNFLLILIKKNNLSLFVGMYKEFQLLYYEYKNIIPIEIISAVQIDETGKKIIVETIESMMKKKVIPNYKIEPEIIGGIIIKAGLTIYDGSINAYLNNLKVKVLEGT